VLASRCPVYVMDLDLHAISLWKVWGHRPNETNPTTTRVPCYIRAAAESTGGDDAPDSRSRSSELGIRLARLEPSLKLIQWRRAPIAQATRQIGDSRADRQHR
jgi:hypothetical protein